jgi:hypothetical protein
MVAAERHAKAGGKTLLMLDTAAGGEAERHYERLKWTRSGVILRYAMSPDGRWCGSTILWEAIPECYHPDLRKDFNV